VEVNLSIITPTLNAETFIGDTLSSIEGQNYPELEVIIVDGGSTDRTLEIADTFKKLNIKVIELPGSSQTEAINEGIKRARGDFLNWINSDDVLLPEALQAVKHCFESNQGIDILYGSASKIDDLGNIIKPARSRSFSRETINNVYFVTQPSTFYRTSIIKRVNGLRSGLEFAMDWDLMLRISNNQNTLSIDQELARLRIHVGTKTSIGGKARMKEIAQIAKTHFGFWNRNTIAYLCLIPFFNISNSTGWKLADRIGSILSRGFDKVWGHMNYMVHYHSFECQHFGKPESSNKKQVASHSQLIAENTVL